MLANRTAPNADLQRLVDEGYEISLEGSHLIVHRVPYVKQSRTLGYGTMISTYAEHAGVPAILDHWVFFTGSIPYRDDGVSLESAMVANSTPQTVAGRTALCQLSYKPEPIGDMLSCYYNKLTHYIRKLGSYASAIDSTASARGRGSFTRRDTASVFHYPNWATARAGLEAYEAKLELKKVAIVGLGGTGAYILDGLAKTPVAEIHLFDGDIIEPHNAFRVPGALPIETVYGKHKKTDLLQQTFSQFRTGIVSHPEMVAEANLGQLHDCQFVFIAVDHGPSRGLIARYLANARIPFIDVGIGVDKKPDLLKLHGRARVTLVTPDTAYLVDSLPTADDSDEAVYGNIQLAELNSINANLALIRYKQHLQFFTDEISPNVINYKCSWNHCTHQ
ncbi:ThiF family adenylyltransferase [Cupriavidus taiwanensis]|uniref:ThiF family adenylyltransferase n=1 Tax=Cupriavidus taiwanensis TaxID=164546 RepID=UPI000E106ACB|nr:ThiF family adenylyltransferase [Cupriavidus taiwanensis]SOY76894.1 conserved hypothetical protein. putative ubiquitin-activating enzyme (E1) like [Cupriavidus taiwanensis]SOZ00844.1 conserved hypothetical protein. putative ubiquitin-activating enzyme (E1) like [Cupriavidus taiwanensis]SPD61374.1 conserved protein of unknown function [Cupriavidus taiwanensis]